MNCERWDGIRGSVGRISERVGRRVRLGSCSCWGVGCGVGVEGRRVVWRRGQLTYVVSCPWGFARLWVTVRSAGSWACKASLSRTVRLFPARLRVFPTADHPSTLSRNFSYRPAPSSSGSIDDDETTKRLGRTNLLRTSPLLSPLLSLLLEWYVTHYRARPVVRKMSCTPDLAVDGDELA